MFKESATEVGPRLRNNKSAVEVLKCGLGAWHRREGVWHGRGKVREPGPIIFFRTRESEEYDFFSFSVNYNGQ